MSDDTLGCLAAVALTIGAGYWTLTHYEIRKKPRAEAVSVIAAPRPSGMMLITETKSGSVWRLNAESVRGDRHHRQGWVIVDAGKDKTIANWRFHHVLYMVDCDTTATRELSSIFYKADGTSPWPAESADASKADPSYFPEGTIGYAPVEAMCDAVFDVQSSSV